MKMDEGWVRLGAIQAPAIPFDLKHRPGGLIEEGVSKGEAFAKTGCQVIRNKCWPRSKMPSFRRWILPVIAAAVRVARRRTQPFVGRLIIVYVPSKAAPRPYVSADGAPYPRLP